MSIGSYFCRCMKMGMVDKTIELKFILKY